MAYFRTKGFNIDTLVVIIHYMKIEAFNYFVIDIFPIYARKYQ